MRTLTIGLLTFATLSAGCLHRNVLPDQGQVHQLSKPADVEVWCHGPETETWTKCKVTAAAGWWIAPPSIVESPP
jgi:hypothetical protein